MGVSTVASYTGAQVFEAVGLGFDTSTSSSPAPPPSSVASASMSSPTRWRPGTARCLPDGARRAGDRYGVGGEYQWRREGEDHLFNPQTVFKLQHARRGGPYDVFKEYTR